MQFSLFIMPYISRHSYIGSKILCKTPVWIIRIFASYKAFQPLYLESLNCDSDLAALEGIYDFCLRGTVYLLSAALVFSPLSSLGKKTIPAAGRGGPLVLWDVEAPSFFRLSAYTWRWSCQSYAPAALYSPGRFLVLVSGREWVYARAILRLK
jgi:hypothetical protein